MPISTSKQSQRTQNINQAQTVADQGVAYNERNRRQGNVKIGKRGQLIQNISNTYSGLSEVDLTGILNRIRPGAADSPATQAPALPFTSAQPEPILDAVTDRAADQIADAPADARKRVAIGIVIGIFVFILIAGVLLAVLLKPKRKGTP